MEDLACQIGLPNVDHVIEGCFKTVKLQGCIPDASLKFFQKVVKRCPDQVVFIGGGYASYVMGLKSDFASVDIYVLCQKEWEHGNVYGDVVRMAKRLEFDSVYRPMTGCERAVWSIYNKQCWTGWTVSDIDVEIVVCKTEDHGLTYDDDDEPISGWKRYVELEESGHVPKSDGRYRYVEMLEAVMQSDIFQSMCIIESVDLTNGQCSAMTLHQFKDAVADIDLKSRYVDQKREPYAEIFNDAGIDIKSRDFYRPYRPRGTISESMFEDVMFDFWNSLQERYKRYRVKTYNKIVIPSLTNLSLGKMLTETRDLDKYYDGQKPDVEIWPK